MAESLDLVDPTSQLAETGDDDTREPGTLVSDIAQAYRSLDPLEQSFISGLVEGLDADTSANLAGWRSKMSGAKALGRPRVKIAIQTIAPYLPVKVGSRLIAPYVLERLTGIALNGSDAQSLHAARDLLNLAGLGPVSRSESVTANLSDIIGALEKRRVNEAAPAVTVDTESKRMVRR